MPGKLTYFSFGVRAEPIRALCYLARHEFEDNRVSFDDFPAIKDGLPLGSLPTWEEDGVTYAQSTAILRMLGIRFGFYTTDANTAWEIDSLLDFMEEKYNDMITYCFKPLTGQTVSEEDKAKFDAYFEAVIPFLEARLNSHNKKWIAGTDNITIADLKVYQGLVMLLLPFCTRTSLA